MRLSLIYVGLCASLGFIASGCRTNTVIVEKSERLQSLNKSIKSGKVMYLNPEITVYTVRKQSVEDLLIEEKIQKNIKPLITSSAKKNNLNIEILDTQSEIFKTYSRKLQTLRSDIALANILQDNMIDRKRTKGTQKVFVYTPKLMPEHAELSKIAGTPFFAFCGVFYVSAYPETAEAKAFMRKNRNTISPGSYFYFYNMVVNVESGEMIYRELRKVPMRAGEEIMHTTVYDSFYTLKKQLRK